MKTEKEPFYDFFEDFADPFVSFDTEYNIVYLNKKAVSLSGRKREELIGKNIYTEFPKRIPPELHKKLMEASRTQQIQKVQFFSNVMQRWMENLIYPSPLGVSIFIKDISEQKEMERKLLISELNYQSIMNEAADAIMITDDIGNFYDANAYFCKLLGYTYEEVPHLNARQIIDPEQLKNDPPEYNRLLSGDHMIKERRLLHKNGTIVDVELNITKLPDGKQLVIARDIRERKKIERALIESEARFKSISENAPIGIGCSSVNGNITFINNTFTEITGYTLEDIPDIETYSKLVYPDEKYREYAKSLYSKDFEQYTTNKTNNVSRIQVDIRCKNGETKHVEILRTFGENIVYFMMNDISKQKKATDELLKSHETLQKLSSYLQDIREEERTKVAREIHDELGQQLTSLKMGLSMLNKKVDKKDTATQEKFVDMMALVDETVKTVRRIATELRPGILDDLGLTAALDWQSTEFKKRTGINCKFTAEEFKETSFEQNLATGIFRVYQEALTNITRHAGATKVETKFGMDKDYIVLTIEDNGVGFNTDEIKNKNSLGLVGMKERALMFDGELIVDSKKDYGTIITLKVPIKIDLN